MMFVIRNRRYRSMRKLRNCKGADLAPTKEAVGRWSQTKTETETESEAGRRQRRISSETDREIETERQIEPSVTKRTDSCC